MPSIFPRDVLDEVLDLIESVSGSFPTYSFNSLFIPVCTTLASQSEIKLNFLGRRSDDE